jgi:flagella basal body P-ring formation protein FlgA
LKMILKFVIGFGIGIALSTFGYASEKNEVKKDEEKVEAALRQELGKRYPGAAIDFLAGSTFPIAGAGQGVSSIRILSDGGTGTADYAVIFSDGTRSIAQARFSAWFPTYVSTKRIHPGEKLSKTEFRVQSVNVAEGLAYQYRGVMLNAKEAIDGLQARQTILEGQYPLTSGVEKVPDIRRGDAIQLRIQAGEILLTTGAIVQEPGYLNQNVRVLTQKTKKELTGQLREGGVVEVKL